MKTYSSITYHGGLSDEMLITFINQQASIGINFISACHDGRYAFVLFFVSENGKKVSNPNN